MSFIINEMRATPITLPLKEIARYMGMRFEDMNDETLRRVEKLLPRFLDGVRCQACWMELPLRHIGNILDFRLMSVESSDLARSLEGCNEVVLFAATIGSTPDRLCRSASISSPSNAVILDAMGSAAIEWFCDELCSSLGAKYPEFDLRPRFSPGYGDLPLQFQGDLIRILDTPRKIGLTLSESMMMLPKKSVTAIVGLRPHKQ